jgi:hypothetical protein
MTVRAGMWAILMCVFAPMAAISADTGFDRNLSARYIVLTKSFTRDPHASYKTWDYYISPPVHYPGASACKGNSYGAFRTAAGNAYIAHVNALYGRVDKTVSVFDSKTVVLGDGWPSDPLLTRDDATGFIQRYIANLQALGRETDYGGYAINQIGFSFNCSTMLPAKTPAVPAARPAGAAAGAGSPSSKGGILLADDKPSSVLLEAQRAQRLRNAEIEAESKRSGARRDEESRRLEAKLAKAGRVRDEKCEGTKPVSVSGHSDPDTMAMPTALFPGWSTRDKALASARRGLGAYCRNTTGEAGVGGIRESCSQDRFGKWTCTVDAACTKQVPKCPTGAQ